VSGFLHVFAVLQRKLYKDTSQVELLRELLSLQEEMFILLLSMLEGEPPGLFRKIFQSVSSCVSP
jgi:ryanodine receptor 2